MCLHCPHRGCEPNEKEQRTGGKRKQLLKYRSKIKILVGTQWFLHALWIVKSSRNCIFYKKVLWLYSFWLILLQLFFIFKFSAIFLTSLFKKTENFSFDFQGSLRLTPMCCMTPEDYWVTLRQNTFIFQDTTEGKGIIFHIKKLLRNSNGSQNIKCCPYKSKIKTMKTYSVIIFFSRGREWRNSRAYLLSFPHSDNLFARLKSSADWQSSVQGQLITSSHLNVVYQVS